MLEWVMFPMQIRDIRHPEVPPSKSALLSTMRPLLSSGYRVVCVYTCIHVYLYVYMHICVCLCVRVCIYIYVLIYI